ncbi:hypothetical protein, partial [Methylibium sp.]|uniref:hypothetical protein n=1 Tax=Methylibium sp. TaxID=2067992 RepID=UPI0017A6083B
HWDAALRAATGVRPVNDLWGSPLEFDWHHAEVFVDDKASPLGETGRLIPLPRALCAQFKADYVDRHVPWVLSQLASTGSPVEAVPSLLFFITSRGGGRVLEQIQNRHRSVGGSRIYEDPFPLNVFSTACAPGCIDMETSISKSSTR